MTLSEAIEAATVIIGCYPSAGSAGQSYIGALAAQLGSYPKSVAEAAADRVHGIARDVRGFPLPQIAEVVAWCERKIEPLRKQFDRDQRLHQQLDARQEFEGIQVARSSRLSLFELKEKYGDWNDDWRSPGTKAREIYEAAREKLIGELGENGADIFDSLPDRAE